MPRATKIATEGLREHLPVESHRRTSSSEVAALKPGAISSRVIRVGVRVYLSAGVAYDAPYMGQLKENHGRLDAITIGVARSNHLRITSTGTGPLT